MSWAYDNCLIQVVKLNLLLECCKETAKYYMPNDLAVHLACYLLVQTVLLVNFGVRGDYVSNRQEYVIADWTVQMEVMKLLDHVLVGVS